MFLLKILPIIFLCKFHLAEQRNELSRQEIEKFVHDTLLAHNQYRAVHQVAPVRLNPVLNELAQKEAERSLRLKHFDYNPDLKYRGEFLGRNSAQGWSTFTKKYTGADFTNLLYKPTKKYNYSLNRSQNAETFTQIVWKRTQEIGVGLAGKNDESYAVIVYYPQGNVIGTFTQNVLPPRN